MSESADNALNDAGRADKIAELLQPRESAPEAKPDTDIASEPEVAAPADPAPDPIVSEQPETEPEPAAAESEPAGIDYDQEIPLGAGLDSIKLGELKDFYQSNQDWQTERDSYTSGRMAQDNEVMATRQHLVELARQIGTVDPAVIQRASGQLQLDKTQQRELLMKAKPEWRDADVMKAAGQAHIKHLAGFGIPESLYLSLDDHKLIKFIDDSMVLHEQAARGREALQAPKPVPKPTPKPSNPKSRSTERANAINQARNGTNTDQVHAVAALLGEAK